MDIRTKKLQVTKELKVLRNWKDTLEELGLQLRDFTDEDYDIIGETYYEAGLFLAPRENELRLSIKFEQEIFDWRFSICEMNRAIMLEDNKKIRKMLAKVVEALERKIVRFENYLENGTFVIA